MQKMGGPILAIYTYVFLHKELPFGGCVVVLFVSDIAIFVLKRDVKLQLTN